MAFVPTLVVLDEYWIDLPESLPAWPTIVSNGVIPLFLTLAGMLVIYKTIQKGAMVNRSEALIGLFTFVIVSFIILTIIGIFLRGENMVLVFPF